MEFNRVFLYGNLTRDPESRSTSTGAQVTSFTIAVNERRKAKDGKEEVMFIKVSCWDKQAELVDKYLRKGSGVLVEGRLKVEEYTSREGEKRRDPVVVATSITFGPKSGGAEGGEGGGSGSNYSPAPARESRGNYGSAPTRSAPPAETFRDEPAGGTEDDLPF